MLVFFLKMLGHLKRGYGEDLLAIDGASAYFNSSEKGFFISFEK